MQTADYGEGPVGERLDGKGVVYSYQRCIEKEIEDVDTAGEPKRSVGVRRPGKI